MVKQIDVGIWRFLKQSSSCDAEAIYTCKKCDSYVMKRPEELDEKCPYCGYEVIKTMTINEYQKEALRTASGMNKEYPMLLNGVLGLAGESGECVDLMKKHLFQGHDLDKEHMAKELGDVAWYLAIAAHGIGYDLEKIMQMNVDKLRKRYPDGFEAEKSINRKIGDV